MMVWCLMLGVHIWGGLRGFQPITGTLETGFWAVLTGLSLALWPIAAWDGSGGGSGAFMESRSRH